MTTKVITKKSTIAGKVPQSTDLEIGELAVNTADGVLYTKHSDNSIVTVGGSGGGGGTTNHALLFNRSIPDQHPISAITGLTEALSSASDHNTHINRDAVDSHPITAITGLQSSLTGLEYEIDTTFNAAQKYHGFWNQTDATMTYDEVTRTVTLTQTGGVKYWFKGTEVVGPPTITVTIGSNPGSYFLYFTDMSAVPVVSNTQWDILEDVFFAFVYYNGSQMIVWEERHAAQRDPKYHSYLHDTQHTQLGSGCRIQNYTLESPLDMSMTYTLTAGTIFDEDIKIDIDPYPLSASGYTSWYRTGSNWTFDESSTMPYMYEPNGFIKYDNNGTLTQVMDECFVNYWVYATTTLEPKHRMFAVVGQTCYTSLGDALYEGIENLVALEFPVIESVPLYRITYAANSTYGSSGKVQIVAVVPIDKDYNPVRFKVDYVDLSYKPSPDSPPAESTRIFAADIANRFFPTFKGPVGVDTALQPMLGRNKVSLWSPAGNVTTAPGVFGLPSMVTLGNPVARNVGTLNYLDRMRRYGTRSNTSVPSFAGGYFSQRQFTTGTNTGDHLGGFFWMCRFGIYDEAVISGARMFVGVQASSVAPTNVQPNTLLNCVGLAQLSTNSTQMYIVSGGATLPNAAVPLGTSFPIDTTTGYEFALFSPQDTPAKIYWRVTNLDTMAYASGVVDSNVPSNTTLLTSYMWRCNNAVASRVGMDIATIYIETEE